MVPRYRVTSLLLTGHKPQYHVLLNFLIFETSHFFIGKHNIRNNFSGACVCKEFINMSVVYLYYFFFKILNLNVLSTLKCLLVILLGFTFNEVIFLLKLWLLLSKTKLITIILLFKDSSSNHKYSNNTYFLLLFHFFCFIRMKMTHFFL